MNADATSVVSRPRPVAEPRLRLFVFPHAGGSSLMYRPLARALPADWEVCLVDLPGHGRLQHEPLLDDPAALASRVYEDLLVWLDRPFAFFGHSMGSLLAHDLVLRLDAAGLPLPRWLGLSARGAPRAGGGPGAPAGEDLQRHLLPSARLREVVGRLGGTSSAILRDDGLWQVVEPVLRADLKIVETWRFSPAKTLPPVPLSVLGGRDDPMVDAGRLAAWAEQAPSFVGLRLFPGHHFYFTEQVERIARTVVADVRRAMDGGPPDPAPASVVPSHRPQEAP
ncbi:MULTISPECIES: thioesterase II family protein [Streptomyces]|uniref:thioesterase II family protein n=1 Tax=Streptomyces TaxID=1883 RepID=UPI00093E8F59|nr:alpha/beta fold hydrolase [Streptomyces sp. CB02130]